MMQTGVFHLIGFDNCKEAITINFEDSNFKASITLSKKENYCDIPSTPDETSETSLLSITGQNSQEQIIDLALNIKNLLSLALGKSIIFHKYHFISENDEKITNREMVKNYNEGEQIIPDFQIKEFLNDTLNQWTSFPKAIKDNFFIIINYLNQTRHGFIEDRLLRTVQAWECAATYWIKELDLPDNLLNLKRRISTIFKEWKTEYNYFDDNGELGTKLSSVLNQEKLIIRLKNLVNESGLDTSRINIDFRELKTFRDKTAHTGKIHLKGDEAINHLRVAIRGLQLILLKKLGYSGLVFGENNNWRTIDKISDYFI